jgi:hypothetical protein
VLYDELPVSVVSVVSSECCALTTYTELIATYCNLLLYYYTAFNARTHCIFNARVSTHCSHCT